MSPITVTDTELLMAAGDPRGGSAAASYAFVLGGRRPRSYVLVGSAAGAMVINARAVRSNCRASLVEGLAVAAMIARFPPFDFKRRRDRISSIGREKRTAMKENFEWDIRDRCSMRQCFFCKKRPAATNHQEEVYRTIRNTTGGPGYVVNFTKALIPIPVCSECREGHREINKQVWVLRIIAWVAATSILSYLIYDPADGWVISFVLGGLAGIPLSFVPLVVFITIWGLFSKKTDQVASSGDYPVIKKLLSMGWQSREPRAKYDGYKNEGLGDDDVKRLNTEYQTEAREVIVSFQRWCQAEADRIPT